MSSDRPRGAHPGARAVALVAIVLWMMLRAGSPAAAAPSPASEEASGAASAQQVEETDDDAERRLNLAIWGLVGAAVVIAGATFAYWRYTRPSKHAGDQKADAVPDEKAAAGEATVAVPAPLLVAESPAEPVSSEPTVEEAEPEPEPAVSAGADDEADRGAAAEGSPPAWDMPSVGEPMTASRLFASGALASEAQPVPDEVAEPATERRGEPLSTSRLVASGLLEGIGVEEATGPVGTHPSRLVVDEPSDEETE